MPISDQCDLDASMFRAPGALILAPADLDASKCVAWPRFFDPCPAVRAVQGRQAEDGGEPRSAPDQSGNPCFGGSLL